MGACSIAVESNTQRREVEGGGGTGGGEVCLHGLAGTVVRSPLGGSTKRLGTTCRRT